MLKVVPDSEDVKPDILNTPVDTSVGNIHWRNWWDSKVYFLKRAWAFTADGTRDKGVWVLIPVISLIFDHDAGNRKLTFITSWFEFRFTMLLHYKMWKD